MRFALHVLDDILSSIMGEGRRLAPCMAILQFGHVAHEVFSVDVAERVLRTMSRQYAQVDLSRFVHLVQIVSFLVQ